MPYTIAQAVAEVRARVRDTTSKLATDTQLTTLLARGCDRFAMDTRLLRMEEKVVSSFTISSLGEASITESTLSGSSLFHLLAFVRVEWNVDTSGTLSQARWYPLNIMSMEEFTDAYIKGNIYYSTTRPWGCAMGYSNANPSANVASAGSSSLFLFPNPAVSVPTTFTNRLRFSAIRSHSNVSTLDPSSALEFPEHIHEGPVVWCEWKAFQRDNRNDIAGARKAEYDEWVQVGKTLKDMIDGRPSYANVGPIDPPWLVFP